MTRTCFTQNVLSKQSVIGLEWVPLALLLFDIVVSAVNQSTIVHNKLLQKKAKPDIRVFIKALPFWYLNVAHIIFIKTALMLATVMCFLSPFAWSINLTLQSTLLHADTFLSPSNFNFLWSWVGCWKHKFHVCHRVFSVVCFHCIFCVYQYNLSTILLYFSAFPLLLFSMTTIHIIRLMETLLESEFFPFAVTTIVTTVAFPLMVFSYFAYNNM